MPEDEVTTAAILDCLFFFFQLLPALEASRRPCKSGVRASLLCRPADKLSIPNIAFLADSWKFSHEASCIFVHFFRSNDIKLFDCFDTSLSNVYMCFFSTLK